MTPTFMLRWPERAADAAAARVMASLCRLGRRPRWRFSRSLAPFGTRPDLLRHIDVAVEQAARGADERGAPDDRLRSAEFDIEVDGDHARRMLDLDHPLWRGDKRCYARGDRARDGARRSDAHGACHRVRLVTGIGHEIARSDGAALAG